jgi:uncharacterized protein (TIGR03118 family)
MSRVEHGPRPPVAWTLALGLAAVVAGCGNDVNSGPGFTQTNLVSNTAGPAPIVDPNLVNAWGLAQTADGPWWVANDGSGVSTAYDGTGTPDPAVITIPPPAGSAPGTMSMPTGIAANPSSGFVITAGDRSAPATFVFATEDGTIAGWAPAVDAATAVIAIDNSATNAVYTGVAFGTEPMAGTSLFATNFNAGTVEVFDPSFSPVTSGGFVDRNLPAGYAPFGIQNIAGNLYVTYAKQDAHKQNPVTGGGNGYVDVFDVGGNFIRRFSSQGQLNAPWGLTQAPASFGRFGGGILIANFGDGHINAFDPVSGTFLGQLNRPNGSPVRIVGLRGLGFGNGGGAGSVDTLYFTAGPNDQTGGLFGMIEPQSD